MSARAALAVVAAALVAVAAASGADSFDPKVKLTKADQARASASLLQIGDLGPAWAGGPHKPTSLKVPLCNGPQPDNRDLTITGHAEALFTLENQGLQVDSDVEVFRSAAQVQKLVSRMIRPALGGCLRYDLVRSLGATGTIGQAAVKPIAKAGDRVALYRVPVTLTSGAKTVVVNDDFLFLSVGRTQFFVNVVSPSSLTSQITTLEGEIAKRLAGRAKAA